MSWANILKNKPNSKTSLKNFNLKKSKNIANQKIVDLGINNILPEDSEVFTERDYYDNLYNNYRKTFRNNNVNMDYLNSYDTFNFFIGHSKPIDLSLDDNNSENSDDYDYFSE